MSNVLVKHLSPEDQKLEEVNALHMLYHISDLDGEGSIDNVELSKLLNQLGWAASPEVATIGEACAISRAIVV